MEKAYNHKQYEEKIYRQWEDGGAFTAKIKRGKKPYVIAIPPPNITGSLHIGHALNNTIQDFLIRWQRLAGEATLWLPGTDHAGIATQNVVEKELAKEGLTRHNLGREKFVERVWQWKEKYSSTIISQLKQLGCSCDWTRQRFTMDEGYSKAVTVAFIHYYKKGWIYRGERVINWCPRCQTALSDVELEYRQEKTILSTFRYAHNFPIAVATTRPETKLGDTGVAVHPDDERYQKYIGREIDKIKIIADPSVDRKFGTGAVGLTPAHSLIDEALAKKHGLKSIKIIDEDGRMTAAAGKEYEGLPAVEARQKYLARLRQEKLLEGEEEIEHNISRCYRCGTAIEPLPSKQWFLKMEELVKPAIEAVKSGQVEFIPKRWEKVYLDWMENIRDWCISRQIWWGHRLPVWQPMLKVIMPKADPPFGRKSKKLTPTPNGVGAPTASVGEVKIKEELYVGENPPEGYEQVPDVLDTWFSSALWPFATLGWPEKTADLDYFYPTTLNVTDRGIINLWVARMIFSGLEFMGEAPFAFVHIHPTVFNIEGRRMSKSLGTGIDPLEIMDKYGADALRFGLLYQDAGGQDMRFSEEAILTGQKFGNKLWNIARFVEMQGIDSGEYQIITAPDKNIIEKLDKVKKVAGKDVEKFRFGQMAHELYDFVWHDFADIYIEESKKQISSPAGEENTIKILNYILKNILQLLHPAMPFITESIYQQLFAKNKKDLLANGQTV